jgi:hypothetical protein
MYANEKNGLGKEALPIIMGSYAQSENPDMDDLYAQGWKPL